MKKILLVIIVFLSVQLHAQKYFTKSGTTHFKGSVEAFEPVEATNKSTTVILNTKTGAIASLLFVKAFEFKVALMQEHFNENYMDSDVYPKATFKGNISDFDLESLGTTSIKKQLKGTLTVRGKAKVIDTIVQLKREGGKN